MKSEEIDDFVAQAEWVASEVNAILKGDIDIKKSIENEEKRKLIKEIREREAQYKLEQEEERIAQGVPGKGEKFDRYESFCSHCLREFAQSREFCYVCGQQCITKEQRKEYLLGKVVELKAERARKAEMKYKWENWQKTQALLYRKTSTNYAKWDYFVEEEDEETLDFVPPENDPNFRALEQDIKQRAGRRKQDAETAETLKCEGNHFFAQGKYRNALAKYEAALNVKKDSMVLYNNSAIARIKLQDFAGAAKDCTRVLEYCEIFEEGYEKSRDVCFKALIRRGEANRQLGNHSEAAEDFTRALDLKEDAEIASLLERTREEGALEGLPGVPTGAISSAESLMAELDSEDKLLGFVHAAGCVPIFKRLVEVQDIEALKFLEFLFSDESKYPRLRPILCPVYDKKRTGFIVILESIEKYSNDNEWGLRLWKLLWLCLENTHIREEAVKHSACSKGRKLCVACFKAFVCAREPAIALSLCSILSNFCLSKYKSGFERKPNPGNIKAVVRHHWDEFIVRYLEVLKDPQLSSEALGLLCNLSTEPKLKFNFVRTPAVVEIAVEAVLHGAKSVPVERGLGFLINICTSPTPTEDLRVHYVQILACVGRVLSLAESTEDIVHRGFLLLFRLLLLQPQYAETVSGNTQVMDSILRGLDSHTEICVKIITAGSTSQGFCELLPIGTIIQLASGACQGFLGGDDSLGERVGNLALAIGKISSNRHAVASSFAVLIESFITVIKEKRGPVRKNVAVCLGKLASTPQNREELKRLHGLEVLQSVIAHLDN